MITLEKNNTYGKTNELWDWKVGIVRVNLGVRGKKSKRQNKQYRAVFKLAADMWSMVSWECSKSSGGWNKRCDAACKQEPHHPEPVWSWVLKKGSEGTAAPEHASGRNGSSGSRGPSHTVRGSSGKCSPVQSRKSQASRSGADQEKR